MKVKLNLGLDSSKNLVVNFSKVEGNFFYYSKFLAEIRKGFVKKN
jgi:hypothetical protein